MPAERSEYISLGSYFHATAHGRPVQPSDDVGFGSIRAVKRDLLVEATLAKKAVSECHIYLYCTPKL